MNIKVVKKILSLFSKKEKKQLVILSILTSFTASLDAIGILSLLPFMTLVINPSYIETNSTLNYIYIKSSLLGVVSINDFIFFLGINLFLLLIFSLIFKLIIQYFTSNFLFLREFTFGKVLLTNYLYQPYSWFLKNHTSDLSRKILSEASLVVNLSIAPVITILSQLIVVLILILLLFFINTKAASIVAVALVICYSVFFIIVRKRLYSIGKQRVIADKERFFFLSEIFLIIKEIKLGGLENNYIEKFSKSAKTYSNTASRAALIRFLPKYFIESISFGGIILIILYFIKNNYQLINFIPLMSVYIFAGYRLIPSFQQIYSAITEFQFSSAMLDSLHKDTMELDYTNKLKNKNIFLGFNKFIILKNISFHFQQSEKLILKNINITIPIKKKIAIIGHTGAGKSTIINIILGLLKPTSGKLLIDDLEMNPNNMQYWQNKIGYVPQDIYLKDDTIINNIKLFSDSNEKNSENKIVESAKKAFIHDFIIKELPEQYLTRVGEKGIRLSGGQKQRLAIARALYNDPEVLILDEATNSLDSQTEYKIMSNIYENISNKITVIKVEHRLNTIKNFDKIILIKNGEIQAEGSYDEIIKIYENK